MKQTTRPLMTSEHDQNASTSESAEIEESEERDDKSPSQENQRNNEDDEVTFSEEAALVTEVPIDLKETEAIATVEFEKIVEVTTSDKSGEEQQPATDISTQVDTDSLAENSEFVSAEETSTLTTLEVEEGNIAQLSSKEGDQDNQLFDVAASLPTDNEQDALATSVSVEPTKQVSEVTNLDLKDPNHDEKLEQSTNPSEAKQIKPAIKQEVFPNTELAQETLPDEASSGSGEISTPQVTSSESNTSSQHTNSTSTAPISSSTDNPTAGPTASPTAAETNPDSTVPVDRARFVQRVSGAFRAAQQRDGEIQLRLSPPELGSLKIEISVKQGVMTAQLETDTTVARNLLLDNLPALRERLAEQNISIEKFDVDVRDEGSQQDPQAQTKDKETNNSQSGLSSNRRQRTESQKESTEAKSQSTTRQIASESGLDVMI